jgi:cell pole-organizing protein PopZ
MEEILASIRRILNEDDAPGASPDATGEVTPEDDVLVLDQSMMVSGSEAANDAPMDAPMDAVEPEAVAPPPAAEPAPPETTALTTIAQPVSKEPPVPNADLLAPEAAAAAALSVGDLMRTLAAGRSTQVYSGGPTLEDLVRSELRPMLKEWLDANLPPVVERLVRAEIERVVGRAVP